MASLLLRRSASVAATIECAVDIKAVKPADLERVIVDSTVQSKAIAHPVNSRLLEIARHKLVHATQTQVLRPSASQSAISVLKPVETGITHRRLSFRGASGCYVRRYSGLADARCPEDFSSPLENAA